MIALDTLAAFVAVEGRLPINVKLLIEGEEETGSPSLPGILERHRDLLSADAVLSADGARWRPDLVALNVGSRGNSGFEIRVQTAAQDLHSGRFGGIGANPLHVLSTLIAGLHDDQGQIAAPGFYDGVNAPTHTEQQEIAAIPYDETAAFDAIGAQPHGEAGYSTLERLWMRATLDVNGMWGGYTGAGTGSAIRKTGGDGSPQGPTARLCNNGNRWRPGAGGCLCRAARSSVVGGRCGGAGTHNRADAAKGTNRGVTAPDRDRQLGAGA